MDICIQNGYFMLLLVHSGVQPTGSMFTFLKTLADAKGSMATRKRSKNAACAMMIFSLWRFEGNWDQECSERRKKASRLCTTISQFDFSNGRLWETALLSTKGFIVLFMQIDGKRCLIKPIKVKRKTLVSWAKNYVTLWKITVIFHNLERVMLCCQHDKFWRPRHAVELQHTSQWQTARRRNTMTVILAKIWTGGKNLIKYKRVGIGGRGSSPPPLKRRLLFDEFFLTNFLLGPGNLPKKNL